jgi:hypothetical protein
MSPPTIGPMMPNSPQAAPKTPWIRARSLRSKMSPEMVIAIGCMAPAPAPWRARKAMSCGIDRAAPLAIEPSRKTAMPKSMIGLRP